MNDLPSSMSGRAPVDPPRVTQRGRHSTVALAVTLGCVGYVAAHGLHAPHPNYLPVTGGWAVDPPAGAIAMGYYGLLLYAFAGALVGAVLGRLPGLADRMQYPSVAAGLARVASLTVFAALAYFVVTELGHWG